MPRLRWWIGGLLFASTVINYIDRQTVSVLAPWLKQEYRWSNADFATVLIAFRVAYTIFQVIAGRMLDWLGTRRGLAWSVAFYSLIAMLTSAAQGIGSFRVFRFLLGAGEAANWPGAAKAVAEWFPAKERAWAVALFDSGSSIGGAIAPFLVLYLHHTFGSWRPAFLLTGCLGFVWLLAWRIVYRRPEEHPWITERERKQIQQESEDAGSESGVSWRRLLRYHQTWGIVIGRALLDPYWYMIAEWFAVYLVSKGFSMEKSMLGFWAPFLAADLGNFFGGALSSWWIARGWPVGKARRTVLAIFAPSMLVLIGAVYTHSFVVMIALFAYATFAYAACATMFLSFPADVFQPRAVASVSGLSGFGAGLVTLLSTWLIGEITDRMSFAPVLITASVVPCIAAVVLVTMVRSSSKPDPAGLLRRF